MFLYLALSFGFFFAADNDATVDEHQGDSYQYQQCSTYIRKFYTSIYSPAEERSCKVDGTAREILQECVQ